MWFVFEGLDGVGKSALIAVVEELLVEAGCRVQQLATPTPALRLVRTAVESFEQFEVLLGFYIGCAGTTGLLIEYILNSNLAEVVLVDRYIYSTLALAYGRCVILPVEITQEFDRGSLCPTGGFLVKCDEGQRRARLERRGDQRELQHLEDQDVMSRTIDAYERFSLHVVNNDDGRLAESATEVAKLILNHRYVVEREKP